MIERIWRSLKYDCVYLHAFETGIEARTKIGDCIRRYNEERPHSSLDDRTPHEAYWDLPKAGCPGKLVHMMAGGFHLKSAPELSKQWGSLLPTAEHAG